MTRHAWVLVTAAAMTVGCASAADADAPTADDSSLESESAIVTSVNANGTWTGEAMTPEPVADGSTLFNSMSYFTGPAGYTRKMGGCALKAYKSASGGQTTCTTVADCASAPASLPAGGARYCAQPDGETTKKCYYRPGASTVYCAGSPAQSGAAVAPGAYGVRIMGADRDRWITYACFEGCATTDPATSSASFLISLPICQNC